MILTVDKDNEFCYQLSAETDKIDELYCVLIHFREDPMRHCVVKANKMGQFAVFTEGIFILEDKEDRQKALDYMLACDYVAVDVNKSFENI